MTLVEMMAGTATCTALHDGESARSNFQSIDTIKIHVKREEQHCTAASLYYAMQQLQ